MKTNNRTLTTRLFGLMILLATSGFTATVFSQTQQTQAGSTDAQQQNTPPVDPIAQLNLTPEQRQEIRSIRENNREERLRVTQQLRAANAALESALNAENPDEAVVEQRVKDVGAAQQAVMRMRILTEIRVRRVLTAEQRATLRSMQLQVRENRRERMLNNSDAREKRKDERTLKNGNGLGPLLPRRQNQRRQRFD